MLGARRRARTDAPTEWTAVNACLVPVAALDGQEVITSEGLGSPAALHPVQRGDRRPRWIPVRLLHSGLRLQHGRRVLPPRPYCDRPDGDCDHEHGPNGFDLHALSGNLCRCTGYRPIRDAAYALGAPAADDALAARRTAPPPAGRAPPGWRSAERSSSGPPTWPTHSSCWPSGRTRDVVAGSTDCGVEVNIRGARPPLVVAVDRLPELRAFAFGDGRGRIGAALTLTEIERLLDGRVPLLAQMFPQFASRLIRNGATIGGNLGTGSPIGDAPPALLALDASIVLAAPRRAGGAAGGLLHGVPADLRAPDELIRAVGSRCRSRR